ncbi:MAG: L-asparaginase [Thermoanaerobacteraceae bacterium]|jgi:L-asparaginase|nr:L-asparaginase [Thermoanaerobacteraceae bacterium]
MTQKKKIAFLATGGTIASAKGPEGLRPAFTEKEMIELVPELSDIADIQGKLIMNIDSSNMQPEDWKVIATEIVEALKKCDGVVLSHGTDTMAYTSSALTYMLMDLKKPVAVTGAQKSIGEEQSDAAKNLVDSFKVAASGVPGVFLVFNGDIIIGDRATKMKTASFDAFSSVNAPPAGKVRESGESGDGSADSKKLIIEWNDEVLWQETRRIKQIWAKLKNESGRGCVDSSIDPQSRPIKGLEEEPVILYDNLDPRVLLVKLYPGIEPEVLLLAREKGYHSVLIESFGSGGVPFREPRNLLPAIQELISSGITVAVTTQVPFEGVNLSLYEVGVKALEAGAISMGDMTREAALVRLMMHML